MTKHKTTREEKRTKRLSFKEILTRKVKCPKCGVYWKAWSEQSMAIIKRGKCIACILDIPIEDREKIVMEPYEFEREIKLIREYLSKQDKSND